MNILLQWIDLIWLPLAFLAVRKDQRPAVMGFFAACMLMMRLQIELVESTGYLNGFLELLNMSASARAIAVYNAFYVIYLVLALFSPYSKGAVLMAASISFFFAALFTSMVIMVL